ncbi:hypothetical protein ACET3Z_000002 [Daucus carota]
MENGQQAKDLHKHFQMPEWKVNCLLAQYGLPVSDSFTFSFKPVACAITESEIEKYPVVNPDSPTVDKFVIQEESVTQIREKEDVEGPSSKGSVHQFDDDD